MMDSKGMDFDTTVETLINMSPKSQATFLFKLMARLHPAMCRSAIKYSCMRLDSINSKLPEDNPNRQRYEEMRRKRVEQENNVGHKMLQAYPELFEVKEHRLDVGQIIRVFEADEQL